jgi:hypothetical protein
VFRLGDDLRRLRELAEEENRRPRA